MSDRVNIKDLPITAEVKSGDLMVLETADGTKLIDFSNFIISEYNTTFYSVVSANSNKIDANTSSILTLSGEALNSSLTVGSSSLGIGTTASTQPKRRLEVNGDSLFTGHVYIDDDDGDSPHCRMTAGDGYDLDFYMASSNIARIETSNTTGKLCLQTTGGDVGIGTLLPTYMLDVSASGSTPTIRLKTSAADGSPLFRIENGDQKYSIKLDGDNSDALTVRDETGSASRIIINTIGDVGLGINPSTVLHVGTVSACMTLEPHQSTPVIPTVSNEARMYVKGGKLVLQYKDSGNVRYKYLDLTGTGVTWTHSTTAP